MKVHWIVKRGDKVPSDKTMKETLELLDNSEVDIKSAMIKTGVVTLKIEIEGLFLSISIKKESPDEAFVSQSSQDEWLDSINRLQAEKSESYWKDEDKL